MNIVDPHIHELKTEDWKQYRCLLKKKSASKWTSQFKLTLFKGQLHVDR